MLAKRSVKNCKCLSLKLLAGGFLQFSEARHTEHQKACRRLNEDFLRFYQDLKDHNS
jgi:hypothetical protein